MKAEFKNYHNQLGERTLSLEFAEQGNYIGIFTNSGSLTTMLSDTQVDELIKFLMNWKKIND